MSHDELIKRWALNTLIFLTLNIFLEWSFNIHLKFESHKPHEGESKNGRVLDGKWRERERERERENKLLNNEAPIKYI